MSGAAYLVYGHANPASSINLVQIAAGTGGFKITGRMPETGPGRGLLVSVISTKTALMIFLSRPPSTRGRARSQALPMSFLAAPRILEQSTSTTSPSAREGSSSWEKARSIRLALAFSLREM